MKTTNHPARITSVLIALAALASGAWAGSFTNGGFEVPFLFANSSQELPIGDSALPAWVVEGATYSGTLLMNGFPPNSIGPVEGSQFMVFNTGDWPTGGRIAQQFDTEAGHRYMVRFNIGKLGLAPGQMQITAVVTASTGTILGFLAASRTNIGWAVDTGFTFTASTTASTLTFEDTSATTTDADVALDNVSVQEITGCIPSPSGCIAWWPMDEPSGSNANDLAGSTSGALSGTAPVPGVVSRGRRFSPEVAGGSMTADGSGVLNITGNQITLETWVKLENRPFSQESFTGTFGKMWPHVFLIYFESGPDVGLPSLNQWQFSFGLTAADGTTVQPNSGVVVNADGQFHHCAMTYDGTNVHLFVDGSVQRSYSFSGELKSAPDRPVEIKGQSWFSIDEPAIYNRALSPSEIQTIYSVGAFGKCKKPLIFAQPQSQVGLWTRHVTFGVTAFGAEPLKYQWQKGGIPIPNGTNSTLVLTNLQASDEGSFSVVVSNDWGSVTSSNAFLTVNPYGVSIALHPAVTIDGVVGLTYGIQCTTDLTSTNNWQGLANITLSAPTQLWVDVRPATAPQRYYRVVPGPIPIP